MGTHKQYYLTCTACGRQYVGEGGDCYGETSSEIRGLATDDGWRCDVKVPNGSFWDYCTRCLHKIDAEEQAHVGL